MARGRAGGAELKKPGLAQLGLSLRERGSAEKIQAGYMATSRGATGGLPTVALKEWSANFTQA